MNEESTGAMEGSSSVFQWMEVKDRAFRRQIPHGGGGVHQQAPSVPGKE